MSCEYPSERYEREIAKRKNCVLKHLRDQGASFKRHEAPAVARYFRYVFSEFDSVQLEMYEDVPQQGEIASLSNYRKARIALPWFALFSDVHRIVGGMDVAFISEGQRYEYCDGFEVGGLYGASHVERDDEEFKRGESMKMYSQIQKNGFWKMFSHLLDIQASDYMVELRYASMQCLNISNDDIQERVKDYRRIGQGVLKSFDRLHRGKSG